MKNIVDLYFYMTFPDINGLNRRPKYQPFRMNNLSYIRDCVPKGRKEREVKDKSHSISPFNGLPLTQFTPSVVFLRIKNDQMVDCKKAFVHCFQVREVDGEYSSTQNIPGSGFEASLNTELRVNIDLLGMKPLKMEESSVKNEYLVIKVKFTVDTMNVSGGRRLRSVPARLHAHLEDKGNEGESRIMFAVKKVSTMLREWDGHKVRQGKMVLALIPQEKLGIDGDSVDWQSDRTIVPKVLAEAKKPTQHPIVTINIHVDPKGDALSESDTDEENEECSEDDSVIPTTSRKSNKVIEQKEEGVFTSKNTDPSTIWVHEKAPGTMVGTPFGLLDMVEDNLRPKWLNAPMPDVIAWCFRMTDGPYGQDTKLFSNSVEEAIAAAESAPPADVFRFTNSECFLCQYKRKFRYLTSFLYHLSTCHSRLTFKFKENLVQTPVNLSPKKKRKPDGDEDWCHGLIVSLNHKFDGSHEFDITRHYRKYNRNTSAGRLRKITNAWKQPPCFIITKSLARMLRRTPPGTSIESVMFSSKFNDGNFGENQKIIDLHFQTARYAQAHQPYTIQNQHRRVREFVDLNDNEKELLILLNDFFSSFRCLHSPRMTYGIHRVMVRELREKLLEARYYFQFIIHLCNLKKFGRIHEAEWYDLAARLKEGVDYDPRKDKKHCVYSMLTHLEEQRSHPDGIPRKRRLESPPRRSCDISNDLLRESTEPPRLALDRLKTESKTQSEPPKSPPVVALNNLKRKSIETPEEILLKAKIKTDGINCGQIASKVNGSCDGRNGVNANDNGGPSVHTQPRLDLLPHSQRTLDRDSDKSALSDSTNKNVPVARISPFGTDRNGEDGSGIQRDGDDRYGSEEHSKATDDSQMEDDSSQDTKASTSERNDEEGERTLRTFRNTEQRTANSNAIRRAPRKDQLVVRREATQPLQPHEITINAYEDLERRYPFVHQRRLKIIWHFIKEYDRGVIDWH
uniref:VEFS-Box domain-containing protein n=2 Tax=Bursaphelenchus xylophilus TaxID=6326 RepID=A0A1I7RT19_BURXY